MESKRPVTASSHQVFPLPGDSSNVLLKCLPCSLGPLCASSKCLGHERLLWDAESNLLIWCSVINLKTAIKPPLSILVSERRGFMQRLCGLLGNVTDRVPIWDLGQARLSPKKSSQARKLLIRSLSSFFCELFHCFVHFCHSVTSPTLNLNA